MTSLSGNANTQNQANLTPEPALSTLVRALTVSEFSLNALQLPGTIVNAAAKNQRLQTDPSQIEASL